MAVEEQRAASRMKWQARAVAPKTSYYEGHRPLIQYRTEAFVERWPHTGRQHHDSSDVPDTRAAAFQKNVSRTLGLFTT